MSETWKSALGWPGYEVSDQGNVRSLDRITTTRGGIKRRLPGRRLRARINPRSGRRGVTLCCDQRQVPRRIATLVAEAFLGPRPDGMQVAHNDGNVQNDRLSNLRYATRVENMADCRLHGTLARGSKHGVAKLREEQVHLIRKYLHEGRQAVVVAAEFGVSDSAIRSIAKGRNWSWLTNDDTVGGTA